MELQELQHNSQLEGEKSEPTIIISNKVQVNHRDEANIDALLPPQNQLTAQQEELKSNRQR